MAVQLKGQSGWEAAAQAAREAKTQGLYDRYKLVPDDTVRFRKLGRATTWLEGRPVSVAADGSVDVSVGGKIRSVPPERLEVKMRGPRGGVVWEPLIPEEGP